MFYMCSSLQSLNLESFDTSKVTKMSGIFAYTMELTSLNIQNFDTSNVIEMDYMFYAMKYINELDLSNFNTSNVIIFFFKNWEWPKNKGLFPKNRVI